MRSDWVALMLVFGSACALTGCTQNITQTAPGAVSSPSGTTPAGQATTAQSAATDGAQTTGSAATTMPTDTGTNPSPANAASTASGSTAAGSASTAKVAFTDISGLEASKDILDVGSLGVFDATNGTFRPSASVTRGEYVRWLVKANNAYSKSPDTRIHLAEGGEATFVDVPASNPDFKYIQGLANAGYVVGVDKTHFAPDQPLSRQQLLAIKAQVDEGATIAPESLQMAKICTPYTDVDQIDQSYLGPVHEDLSVRTTNNTARVWGSIKTLRPRQAVTRAEAAVSIAKVGKGSAADTLKQGSQD